MILIVTHEADFGEQMVKWLQGCGYAVCLSCQGTEALNLVAQTSPSLVLLNLYLQDPSGLEVLRQLRTQGYAGKVILIAGVSVSTEIPKAYYLGVEQVIGSPLRLGQLESAIRSTIGPPTPQDLQMLKPNTRLSPA